MYFVAYGIVVARMRSIRGNHHALPYGKTRQLLLQVDKNQIETFAKFVILNFLQESEKSYSLFDKDFSLSLRSRSK